MIVLRWIFLISVFSAALHARVYELEALVEGAFLASHELRVIEEEMYKADAQLSEVTGGAFPEISASINVFHRFRENIFGDSYGPDNSELYRGTVNDFGWSGYQMTGSGMQPGSFDNPMMPASLSMPGKNAAAFSLTINQPLYAQGKIAIGIRSAKIHHSTIMCRYLEAKLRVKGNITILFYSALIAQKNVEAHREAVELAEQTHNLSVIRFTLGAGSELDTLTSRLYLENSRADLQKAKSDLRVSHEALILQSGTNRPYEFSVGGEIPHLEFDLTFEETLQRMRDNNPLLNQQKGFVELADELVYMARSDFNPLIYAGVSVSKIGQFNTIGEISRDSWFDDSRIFLGLNWTIFSGMQRTYRLRQAHMDRSVAYLKKMQLEQKYELDMKRAYEEVITSRDRLESIQSIKNLAQKGYSVAMIAFEVGQRTLLEVRNAEMEISKASTAYNSALFAYHRALIELKVMMGENEFHK